MTTKADKTAVDLFANYASDFSTTKGEEMSLQEYLALCAKDPLAYATPAQR